MFIYKFFYIRDTKQRCGHESRLFDKGFHQIWRHRSKSITENFIWIAYILRNGHERGFHSTKHCLILAFNLLGAIINELLNMDNNNLFPIKITMGLHYVVRLFMTFIYKLKHHRLIQIYILENIK